MVIRAALCLIAFVTFTVPARAAGVTATIEELGLFGTWGTDCTAQAGKARSGFRIIVAQPPGGGPTYTTVNIDDGVKTTIHSLVQTADRIPPHQLKLRLRIFGGDVDGGPLPSMVTNTFEQTFEVLGNGRMQMDGRPPIALQRCSV
jgi:hypothetical protein